MPDLNTDLHLNMLRRSKRKHGLWRRIWREITRPPIYGLEWGDPETVPPLRFIRDHFILPYVDEQSTVLEIGPGGGRWTQYLIHCQKLYVVDYYQELLDELKKNFNRPHMIFIRNHGTDFPGVPEASIDYLFSFGAFVHFDLPLVAAYLDEIKTILKPEGQAVIQYADKTKIMAQRNASFGDNDPETMRRLLIERGYVILEEDTTSLWHSSIVRFQINPS